jgi:urease alpha subunit
MKGQRGQLPQDAAADREYAASYPDSSNAAILADNFPVRWYVAKYTINPCIAHGLAEHLGSASWRTSYSGTPRSSEPSPR